MISRCSRGKSRSEALAVFLLLMLFSSALQAKGGHQAASAMKVKSLSLFKQGRRSFQAGQYAQAIRTLEQAHRLHRHPNNLYYIAASYRRLGKLRRSFAIYSDYATTFADLDKRKLLLERYDRKLREEPPCVLTISGTPGAQVLLNGTMAGRMVAKTSLRLVVKGGQHRVELRAVGYHPALWVVQAEFGEEQRRSFVLTREQAAQMPPPLAKSRTERNRRQGFFLEVGVGPSSRSYGIAEEAGWGLDVSAAGGYVWRSHRIGLRVFGELAFASADGGYAGFFSVAGGVAGRVYASPRVWVELGLGLGTTLLLDAAPGVFFFHQEGKEVLDVEGTFALFCVRPSVGVGVDFWRGFSVALQSTLYYSPKSADFGDRVQYLSRIKLSAVLGWTFL
ncbi:MAG: PEGA domain-containing protein [Deltaproteobacteria bacterium]|nr:PEGA domain-containing protein [Deltaproteobacteria bacterium]